MQHLSSMKVKDDDGWLALALASSKRNVSELKLLSANLYSAYKNYESLIANHSKKIVDSSFAESHDLLVEYYEAPPSTLKALLKARRNEHGLSECPSCGFPFVPDTLDHFIPKNDWPEFAVFPNNLVPQCRGCAPTKGEKYFCDKDSSALYIHPIYSQSLSKIGFRVNVNLCGAVPEFEVKFTKIDSITSEEEARVIRHLSQLRVKERFEEFCRQEYRSWKYKLKARKFDVRVAFEQRLREQPDPGEIARDWRTAFYKGALKNIAFIDYLNQLTSEDKFVANVQLTELVL